MRINRRKEVAQVAASSTVVVAMVFPIVKAKRQSEVSRTALRSCDQNSAHAAKQLDSGMLLPFQWWPHYIC